MSCPSFHGQHIAELLYKLCSTVIIHGGEYCSPHSHACTHLIVWIECTKQGYGHWYMHISLRPFQEEWGQSKAAASEYTLYRKRCDWTFKLASRNIDGSLRNISVSNPAFQRQAVSAALELCAHVPRGSLESAAPSMFRSFSTRFNQLNAQL